MLADYTATLRGLTSLHVCFICVCCKPVCVCTCVCACIHVCVHADLSAVHTSTNRWPLTCPPPLMTRVLSTHLHTGDHSESNHSPFFLLLHIDCAERTLRGIGSISGHQSLNASTTLHFWDTTKSKQIKKVFWNSTVSDKTEIMVPQSIRALWAQTAKTDQHITCCKSKQPIQPGKLPYLFSNNTKCISFLQVHPVYAQHTQKLCHLYRQNWWHSRQQ